MPNITKHDLVQEIARSTGFIQADIRSVVEQFLSISAETLCRNQTIEIRGFGTFQTKSRRPRPARNPRTGEEVPLGERRVPVFKFSADIRRRLDQAQLPQVRASIPDATLRDSD